MSLVPHARQNMKLFILRFKTSSQKTNLCSFFKLNNHFLKALIPVDLKKLILAPNTNWKFQCGVPNQWVKLEVLKIVASREVLYFFDKERVGAYLQKLSCCMKGCKCCFETSDQRRRESFVGVLSFNRMYWNMERTKSCGLSLCHLFPILFDVVVFGVWTKICETAVKVAFSYSVV